MPKRERMSIWQSSITPVMLARMSLFSFIDALERAHAFIGERPAGSPRCCHEPNLPGLRTMGLKGFPWLVFYLEFDTHVDVWRVLHARRDLPAWLTDVDD